MLSLDVDAVLLSDVYQLLRSPLSAQDVIITRNDDGSQSLNCGFVLQPRRAALRAFLPGQREQQRVDPRRVLRSRPRRVAQVQPHAARRPRRWRCPQPSGCAS